ncbi:hypothetical protein SUGI_0648540 [Cryptomeria japonica]|nr:hypothetical protein SUGI_0648540 [Cryptomeria japonica]
MTVERANDNFSTTFVVKETVRVRNNINRGVEVKRRHLCARGNDAASEVITEARQLLVENYFQTPSLAFLQR